jgi:hypothetical protein
MLGVLYALITVLLPVPRSKLLGDERAFIERRSRAPVLAKKIHADNGCHPAGIRHITLICWITCLLQGMVNLQVNLVQ